MGLRTSRPRKPADSFYQHEVVCTRRVLRVSPLRTSTAGGREYFACGEGLRGYSESRRPDCYIVRVVRHDAA